MAQGYHRYEYKELLDKDVDLRRWYLNNAKSSVITADVYLRRLGSSCKEMKVTPGEYAKLPKRKMENMAFDFIQEMETRINPNSGKPYAPQYVESHLKAIVSWAKWNRKKFDMKIKIANVNKTPTLEHERVPTTDELRRVLYSDKTSLRTRTLIAIMAFSGCRPEVMGNYVGLDGLRFRDLPECKIDGKEVTFTRIPTLIMIRAELSKARHWYPTFMLEEGCEILKQYFERRIAEGETLTPESGVIVATELGTNNTANLGTKDNSPFIRTTKLGDKIRNAMRAVGLPWRPYVFRSYFDTMQMYAEGKGLISHNYTQTFMGHSDIESVYSFKKSQLPSELLEDMRAAYGRVSEMLSTRKPSVSMNEVELTMRKQILLFSEFTEQEIDKLGDLSKYSIQDLKELDKKKEFEKLGLNSHSTQKIVPWSDLRQHIMNGWELVQRLDDTNEAIIRLPK